MNEKVDMLQEQVEERKKKEKNRIFNKLTFILYNQLIS